MEEKQYLYNKSEEVQYNDNRFKLMLGNDKYIFGILSSGDSEAPFSRLLQYKTIYDSIKDIDYKLKLSFENAIEYSYSDTVQNKFSLFEKGSMDETLAYYYIENALFRTSSLWDLLAQLYRLYYHIDVDVDKVYYSKLFNPHTPQSVVFKDKAIEIYNYINQKDNIHLEGEWKGNHRFVNSCRNTMTHRNSPNVPVISDFDVNLKHHPSYMLKRIVEDYNVVSKYILEILDNIEVEIMKGFNR